MNNKSDAKVLVHSPADLARDHVLWAENIQQSPGVPWGIPSVDEKVIPMRPGNLTCIMGRPGDGKSTLLAYLARTEAKRIVERGTQDKECVVFVTWEQCAEELYAMFQANDHYSATDIAWGRVDLDEVRRRAVKGASLPVWIIGHSISRAESNKPRMFTSVVLEAIRSIKKDYGIKPTLLCFDYLQLVPVQHAKNRVQQVSEAPTLIKELGQMLGVPAVAAVQAKQEVDSRKIKIAALNDCQWASAIGQTADKLFSLWRPIRTEPELSLVEIPGLKSVIVNKTTLILRMLKQRGDQGQFTWALHFAPQYLRLAEMERKQWQ